MGGGPGIYRDHGTHLGWLPGLPAPTSFPPGDLFLLAGAMVFHCTPPLYGVFLGALLPGEPLGLIHLIFGEMILPGSGPPWARKKKFQVSVFGFQVSANRDLYMKLLIL